MNNRAISSSANVTAGVLRPRFCRGVMVAFVLSITRALRQQTCKIMKLLRLKCLADPLFTSRNRPRNHEADVTG